MNGLIRVLTGDEAHAPWTSCCWTYRQDSCDATPVMRLATPHGEQDFCRDHIDHAIASLPPDWIEFFAYREPVSVGETGDDIPF